MFKKILKKIIPVLLVGLFFFIFKIGNINANGIFIAGIEPEGNNLIITVHIPPTYFGTTYTQVPNGVAYADITSPQTVFLQASTSDSFDNIISQSYTVPVGQAVVLSNGDIPKEFTFPTGVLIPNTPYFFRVHIGNYYSNTVSISSATSIYGETLVPQDDFSPYVEFFVYCGSAFGEGYKLTSTSLDLPCLVTSKFENTNVDLKLAWGLESEGTKNLTSMVLSTILNSNQEFTFLANLSDLNPNTSYVMKVVDAESPNLSYTPGYKFMTTDGSTTSNNSNTNSSSSNGSQYGAGDDTDFSSPEYTSSLVRCNGTPTDPCRFNDLADLINRVVKFLIVMILPLSAILFAYAGFLYLTSAGDSETKGKVKKMLMKAVWGIVLVLAAWLIVKTIFWALGVKSDVNLLSNQSGSQNEILNTN